MKVRVMTSIFLKNAGRVLMLYKENSRALNKPLWVAGAGGHMEPSDSNDPTCCVLRELREELNLTEEDLEHFALKYVSLRNNGNELRQNFYFFADLLSPEKVENSTEGALQWTPLEELLKLEMPYTLKVCLAHYLETGRYTQDIYLASVASSILENGNQVQFSTLRPCQQT